MVSAQLALRPHLIHPISKNVTPPPIPHNKKMTHDKPAPVEYPSIFNRCGFFCFLLTHWLAYRKQGMLDRLLSCGATANRVDTI
ncbi:MAG: hypothetical protein RSC68_35585, partial [Acinetobacter sp.]